MVPEARAQSCDSAADTSLDCDNDGWSPAQGDCDDADNAKNPSEAEVCGDQLDNDCDGFFDEECDVRVRLGSLRGGGGCSRNDQTGQPTQTGGTLAILFLPALLAGRRRTRGGRR